MKNWCTHVLLFACTLPIAPLMSGCGSDGGDDDDPAPAEGDGGASTNGPSMTGFWSGSYSTGVEFTMDLVQEDDAIMGTYVVSGGPTGSVSGSLSGNAIALAVSVNEPPTAADFTGSVNDGRTAMGGSFMIIDGGGGSGTWSAGK